MAWPDGLLPERGKGMQKATHSIQYVPVEPKFEKVTDEVREALTKEMFDNIN
jgi:hypothetical protein